MDAVLAAPDRHVREYPPRPTTYSSSLDGYDNLVSSRPQVRSTGSLDEARGPPLDGALPGALPGGTRFAGSGMPFYADAPSPYADALSPYADALRPYVDGPSHEDFLDICDTPTALEHGLADQHLTDPPTDRSTIREHAGRVYIEQHRVAQQQLRSGSTTPHVPRPT